MKQHIIPKSVLKNFTDDKGHLYCFDRGTGQKGSALDVWY